MTIEEYFKLSSQDKNSLCQKLSPYNSDEWGIFQAIEKKFFDQFGHQDGIEKVKCSLAPMMGPYNCIMVFIPKGKGRVKIPEKFEGFPIYRIYESKLRHYKELIK
jgi:hypothetical protein